METFITGAIIFAIIYFALDAMRRSTHKVAHEIMEPQERIIKVQFPNPSVASKDKVEAFLNDPNNMAPDILLKYIEIAENDPDTPPEITQLIKDKLEWVHAVLSEQHE